MVSISKNGSGFPEDYNKPKVTEKNNQSNSVETKKMGENIDIDSINNFEELKNTAKENNYTPDKNSSKLNEKINSLGKKDNLQELVKFPSRNVQEVKAVISDMMAGKGKESISSFRFDNAIDKMDKKELAETAKHINGLMKNTDGKDEMLGGLLDKVLTELESRDKPRKLDNLDSEIRFKYNCSYSTKTQSI